MSERGGSSGLPATPVETLMGVATATTNLAATLLERAMRTEDREAKEEAGYRHVVGRATAPLEKRIEELEIAVRAGLSFVQGRFPDHSDGHAVMIIAALRGALRDSKRE